MKKWSLDGAIILTPDTVVEKGSVQIGSGMIDAVTKKLSPLAVSADVSDCVLVPGLINSHDHLLGTYYPKVGNGPYTNWLPWDNDLKSADVYRERQQIENRDLYLLGGFRNLVSGVTSVQDHIPHFVQQPFLDIMPLKVISDFAMAHSVNSFALKWGEGIDVEYQKAVDEDIPFVTHIAEGFDEVTKKDIETLDRQGGLGDHSVLVHGLAFSDEDMKLIHKKGASVVWCADSNMFMFNTTARIKNLLDEKINVCIGTDSPMSGGMHILHEMRFGREYYRNTYGEDLDAKTIVRMVTENPAKAFRMYRNGKVKEGMLADLTVFRKNHTDPYESVVNASLADVALVIINGLPMYGDAEFAHVFDGLRVEYQRLVLDGVEKLVAGDLKGVLRRINRAVGFDKKFPFLPVEL